MDKKRGILLLLLIICIIPFSNAQENINKSTKWYETLGRWVAGDPWSWTGNLPMTHTKYLLLFGDKGVKDLYLSPIAHNGLEGKALFLTDFAAPSHRKWHFYQDLSLHIGQLKNRANGGIMYHLGIDYNIGPSWRLIHTKGLSLDLAPLLALKFGGNVKLSNTNNIGNVKTSLGLDAWGRVKYQIPWTVMPLSISYSAQLPLMQCAFHPEYGQSYYDYVSGENRAKLGLHFGSLHNTLGIKQRLLVDLPIHNITLTIGAEHTHLSQRLNHTTYTEGSWGVVFGLSIDSFKLSGGKSLASPHVTNRYN